MRARFQTDFPTFSSRLLSVWGGGNVLGIDLMSNADDHRWDLRAGDDAYLPESDEAFDEKFEEWQMRTGQTGWPTI